MEGYEGKGSSVSGRGTRRLASSEVRTLRTLGFRIGRGELVSDTHRDLFTEREGPGVTGDPLFSQRRVVVFTLHWLQDPGSVLYEINRVHREKKKKKNQTRF